MPKVQNKSVRIWALNDGMLPPGGAMEVSQEEFDTPYFQQVLATGELIMEQDQKKVQMAAQKVQQAEQQVEKAQESVSKAEQQVAQAHQKIAEQRQEQAVKASEQQKKQ